MKREVFYICNGKKPDCSKTGCVYTGAGDCGHTRDERVALWSVRRASDL